MSRRHKTKSNSPIEVQQNARLVCGIHACREVVRVRPKHISRAWIGKSNSTPEQKNLEKQLQSLGKKPQPVEETWLSHTVNHHQGFLLEVTETPQLNWNFSERETSTLLILCGLTDPHNFGAIIRTAWLLGVEGILIQDKRSASLTPTVARIASGGVEYVAIERVNALPNVVEDLKKSDFWIYGLDETGPDVCYKSQFPEKTAFVVGGEGDGIPKSIQQNCDAMIRIPQISSTGDFNASVATAMVLYERFRQQNVDSK